MVFGAIYAPIGVLALGTCHIYVCRAVRGGIAEAYFGVPDWIMGTAYGMLPKEMQKVVEWFWKIVGK